MFSPRLLSAMLSHAIRWCPALALGAVLLSSCGDSGGEANPSTVTPCEGAYAGLCGSSCTADGECPDGLYCGPTGTCTADCAPGQGHCAAGQVCSDRGRCVLTLDSGAGGSGGTYFEGGIAEGGAGSGGGQDVCADINVTFEPQIPTVMLLIDQSGSMNADFSGTTRWDAAYDALMNSPDGVVNVLESEVRFGLTLYTSHGGGADCPVLAKVPIALNNHGAIDTVYAGETWDGDTPTGESLDAIIPDVLAVTEPGPKIIVLATDGEPDTCAEPNPQNGQPEAIAAAESAFSQGIQTFIISVGDQVGAPHLQDMANAGVGNPVGGGTNAPYYVANNQSELTDAFDSIINGVRSCVLTLDGAIEPGLEDQGTVLLDGQPLTYDDPDGWRVNSSSEIELLGAACEAIKSGDHEVDVSFPCGTVVINPPR